MTNNIEINLENLQNYLKEIKEKELIFDCMKELDPEKNSFDDLKKKINEKKEKFNG